MLSQLASARRSGKSSFENYHVVRMSLRSPLRRKEEDQSIWNDFLSRHSHPDRLHSRQRVASTQNWKRGTKASACRAVRTSWKSEHWAHTMQCFSTSGLLSVVACGLHAFHRGSTKFVTSRRLLSVSCFLETFLLWQKELSYQVSHPSTSLSVPWAFLLKPGTSAVYSKPTGVARRSCLVIFGGLLRS